MATPTPPAPLSPRAKLRELVLIGVLAALVAGFADCRMGYLSDATAHHVRLNDNSRTAYVAKNLVDGHGYTTNDLPAALLDFYHREGRLDDERWENADRFPFTAYAIAALYELTGSTSYWVGITLYNYLTFVGLMLVLFVLTRTLWGDRSAALVAVALALMHPYTYRFLYLKDADTLLLSTAFFLAFHHFLSRPAHEASRRLRLGMGTLLGWLFLARPNVGAAFVLVLAFLGARQVVRDWRAQDLRQAALRLYRGYAVIAAVMIMWCLPFAIDTMREWGRPFFSANNIYQLPLGTRYGMGTDTWWKYNEPGQTLTLAEMWERAPDDMRAKLTTSWLTTAQWMLRMYGAELFLMFAALVALTRPARRAPDVVAVAAAPAPGVATLATLLGATGFAVVFNLAALPLYSYQNFSFVHYLAFALPMVWAVAALALTAILRKAAEADVPIVAHLRRHLAVYSIAALGLVLIWSLGERGGLANPWFIAPTRWFARHWLLTLFAAGAAIAFPWLWRPLTFTRAVVLVFVLLLARYKPDREIQLGQQVFFAQSDRPGEVLRQRRGVVSSFALQAEVAWLSDRRNVPAPEYATHIFSFGFDHGLAIEDIYLESAEALITPGIGPFAAAAPGFETYARLQRYGGTFPGYRRVFHAEGHETFGRNHVRIEKASTIYRLTDRDAVARLAQSPAALELGRLEAIVHTAYGFAGYTDVDGKPAVVTRDAIPARYPVYGERPAEDVGVTFFLDERQPRALDLEVYAVGPTELDIYANVDLFAYTRAAEVDAHRVATVHLENAGWQTIHLDLRPGLTRRGLNKLGFKPSRYYPIVLCPPGILDEVCRQTPAPPLPGGNLDLTPPRIIRATGKTPEAVRSAMLLGRLTFTY